MQEVPENCSAVDWAEQFSSGQEGGNRSKKNDQPTLQETGYESDIEKSSILKFKEKNKKRTLEKLWIACNIKPTDKTTLLLKLEMRCWRKGGYI